MYYKFPWREVDQQLNSPREFVLRPAIVLGACAPAPRPTTNPHHHTASWARAQKPPHHFGRALPLEIAPLRCGISWAKLLPL